MLPLKHQLPLKSNVPDRDHHVHLLIVGSSALPLAKAVAKTGPDADRQRRVVSMSDALPLRETVDGPAVDLLVFTVCMTQRLSLELFARNIAALGEEKAHFVRGKWALVVFDADSDSGFAFPLEHVESLAAEYGLPLVFCTSTSPASVELTAARLCSMLRQVSRVNGTSPLFAASSFF
jgi:hypothetical protein